MCRIPMFRQRPCNTATANQPQPTTPHKTTKPQTIAHQIQLKLWDRLLALCISSMPNGLTIRTKIAQTILLPKTLQPPTQQTAIRHHRILLFRLHRQRNPIQTRHSRAKTARPATRHHPAMTHQPTDPTQIQAQYPHCRIWQPSFNRS